MSSINQMLELQEQALRRTLDEARGGLTHASSKGSVLEAAVRRWLRSALPSRYWVGHGEIVDRHGGRSKQHDVVVAFDDHPRFFDVETPQPFLLEGVAAVVEVTAELTRDKLREKQEAVEHLRTLRHVALGAVTQSGSRVEPGSSDGTRYLASPPAAFLGFSSSFPICQVGEIIGTESRSLDAVFALAEPGGDDASRGGWARLFGAGERDGRSLNGEPVVGWHHHHDSHILYEVLAWFDAVVGHRQLPPGGVLRPYLEVLRRDSEPAS